MGNSLQHTHAYTSTVIPQRQSKISVETASLYNHHRKTSQSNMQSGRACQITRKHSLNSLVDKGYTESKPKKFLSLSKAVHNEPSILRDSKARKGINIVANQEGSVRYSVDRFIRFENKPTEQNSKNSIKKVPIKPRDLPRYSSHKNITAPASLNTIPLPTKKAQTRLTQPNIRPVSTHQPNINIKYLVPQVQKTDNSLQSSSVTPFMDKFTPSTTTSNWHSTQVSDCNPKKLRKVALSRSYIHQEGLVSVENHEQLDTNKKILQNSQVSNQEDKKMRTCFNIPTKHQEEKENQRVLTDPKLMSYIKENQHLRPFKESESKYALAYYQNGTIVQSSIGLQNFNSATSIVREKYSVGKWLEDETLQGKVGKEVQSQPLIDQKQNESKVLIEEPFRFQTATDISYEQKSDNTSFIPLSNNFRKNLDDNGSYLADEVLNYCKPRINEKVLADLLRLPLKH